MDSSMVNEPLEDKNVNTETIINDDDILGKLQIPEVSQQGASSSSYLSDDTEQQQAAAALAAKKPTAQPLPKVDYHSGQGRRASMASMADVAEDPIQITAAVKTSENSSTPYIAYVIRFGAAQVQRRYSDFDGLRATLQALYPCYIVPPLPPKNSLSSYAVAGTNPRRAKEDAALVAKRRRMLSVFLNRCLEHHVLGQDTTFRRFLDPAYTWAELARAVDVPKNALRASARDPTDAESRLLFDTLPLPASGAALHSPDQRFLDSEAFTARFSAHMSGTVERANRKLQRRWAEIAADWAELGGGMNGFALREDAALGAALERVGVAVDGGCLLVHTMLDQWQAFFAEPLSEYTQFSEAIRERLRFRHLRHAQLETAQDTLAERSAVLEDLERTEAEARRLEAALERVKLGDDPTEVLGGAGGRPAPAAAPSTTSRATGTGAGLLGAITHTIQNIVDADPEATRRSTISRTRDTIGELQEGTKALKIDLKYASQTIQADLDRFQRQKVADMREMTLEFCAFHKEYSERSLKLWEDAREAIDAIDSV